MAIISAPSAGSPAYDDLLALLRIMADPQSFAGELASLKSAASAARDAKEAATAERRGVDKMMAEAQEKLDEASSRLAKAKDEAERVVADAEKRAKVEFQRRMRTAMSALGE